jgi:hypothetical protein
MTLQDVKHNHQGDAQRAALRNRGAWYSDHLHLIGLVALMAGVGLVAASKCWFDSARWRDGKLICASHDHGALTISIIFTALGGFGSACIAFSFRRKTATLGDRIRQTCLIAIATFLLSYAFFVGLLHIPTSKVKHFDGTDYILDKPAFDWALGIGGTAITIGGITAAIGLIGYLGLRNRKKAEAT